MRSKYLLIFFPDGKSWMVCEREKLSELNIGDRHFLEMYEYDYEDSVNDKLIERFGINTLFKMGFDFSYGLNKEYRIE